MTSANPTRSGRGYLSCLDGGDVHSWQGTGLDVVDAALFPRTVHFGNTVLCRTRRCVWCRREQASVYPSGRWKDVP
jgi:hypothetical protein